MNLYNQRVFIKSSGQVAIRVRWEGDEVTFITGVYAEASKWSSTEQKAKKNTTHNVRSNHFLAAQINAQIYMFSETIKEVFQTFFLQSKSPTREELKSNVNLLLGRSQDQEHRSREKTMDEVFQEYLKLEGRNKKSTY